LTFAFAMFSPTRRFDGLRERNGAERFSGSLKTLCKQFSFIERS
jgi:hypothetical protein